MIFHKHKWVIIKETYAQPATQGKFWDFRELRELQCGLTTILWECSVCGKIRKKEMLGKEKD